MSICRYVDSLEQAFHKRLGGLERVLGNGIPEVMILRGIGVRQRHVADHAERDERHVVDVTRLGDGTRLHINGLGVGELLNDATHLVLRIDKPVARHDKSRDDAHLVVRQCHGLLQQLGIRLIAGRKSLHLTINRRIVDGTTAIHVVVAHLFADHHILDFEVVAMSASTTAGDDDVGWNHQEPFFRLG